MGFYFLGKANFLIIVIYEDDFFFHTVLSPVPG